jgi:hypothetical protein
MTPCEEHRDRFTPRKDNPKTRAECRDCPVRLRCAVDALDQIKKGLHPIGIRAGVWLPDDKRADGAYSSPTRLLGIERLRSVAMVLARTLTNRKV